MLALMVIMILVIVLGGLASYQMFMINQTQNLVIQSQKNQSSVAMWKSLLISKAKAVGENNEIVLPIGENKVDYHTVPNWLYFNTKNPWGKDFVYCPFGPISTGVLSQDVSLSLSRNYQVRTVSNFATTINGNNREYVVASSPNGISTDILAFIISPLPSSTNTLPNCANVVFDSTLNAYKVDNGLVDVITKGDVETFANLSLLSGQNNGENSSINYINTVEGDTSVEGNTLLQNLNYIAASDFKYANLKLPSGVNTLESVNLNQNNDAFTEDQKVLIIEGDSDGSTIINGAAGSKVLFNNYKVYLKNIKLSQNIQPIFNYSNLKTENVELSNVYLQESEWLVNGTDDKIIAANNTITSESYGLYMNKSTLNIGDSKKLTINEDISNKNTINASLSKIIINNGELSINKTNNQNGIVLIDSVIKTDNANVNIYSTIPHSSDILVDEFSSILSFNSIFEVSGNGTGSIVNRGSVVFNGTSLITLSGGNYGIISKRNSSLILKTELSNNIVIGNSNAANRPSVAVLDFGSQDIYDGAGYFGGSPTDGTITLYGTTCASGPAFLISGETRATIPDSTRNDYTGISKEVQLFASKLNASNWNCIK